MGGVVWTGVPGQPARRGWGVAVRRGRIQAVGSADDVLNLKGPHTSVQSFEGMALVPGFVDAHVHLLSGGLDLFRLELRGIGSPEDLVQRVADRVRTTPPGEWILGGGWDENAWGGPLPHRSWLDPVSPENPVFLLRTDLHAGLCNSSALALARITSESPDPALGTIDRDPGGGAPTGVLREGALEAVARVLPAPSSADREAALRAAARHALSRGVTQVHDMGALQSAEESWASLHGLRALNREGRLPLRVYAQVPLSERHALAGFIAEEGRGNARLRWGGVKGFVDGSLGASTAWLREPYRHLPGHHGGPITDLEPLRAGILEAGRLGLQPINHAIGDRAVDWLLEVYGELARAVPPRGLWPRIEHAQHLSDSALASVGTDSVYLSMQPAHLVDDGPWIEERIGPERLGGAYPFRRLLDRGARLAFGSDWTVAPLDPMVAIEAAVRRRHRSGGVLSGDESIGFEEALRAHTSGGAGAGPWHADTGLLEPGRWADVAVLQPPPFQGDGRERFSETEVVMTFTGGALAWSRSGTVVEPPTGRKE